MLSVGNAIIERKPQINVIERKPQINVIDQRSQSRNTEDKDSRDTKPNADEPSNF